jgi:hypothetical protein
VSGAAEAKQRSVTNVDERSVADRGVADNTGPADVEWIVATDLRAAAPEAIQLLAATGC